MPRDNSDPQPWNVLSSRFLTRKPWMTIRQDRVRLPTGAVIDEYSVLEYPAWVNIIAVTHHDLFILVRQYRHGLRAVHYELPAGVCDASDVDPAATARRELLEETGYGGGVWTAFMTLSANPGTHSNLTHTYLATGVIPLQKPQLDHTEDMRIHLINQDELRDIIFRGDMMQALHAAPLLKYLLSSYPSAQI
jgi:8-oxo-dGTP pyrophosphatase MutT (NUDIX family)